MAIEFGTLKEALKASPFWLPLNPLPASVDMESFFFQNFYFIYSELTSKKLREKNDESTGGGIMVKEGMEGKMIRMRR